MKKIYLLLVSIGTMATYSQNCFQQISAGANPSAVKLDGTLWTWGDNSYGTFGNGTFESSLTPIKVGSEVDWQSTSSGGFHTLAKKSNGTLWSWGSNSNGQLGIGSTTPTYIPVQVGTSNDWKTFAAANTFSVAIKNDGTLWTWGANNYGQLGIGNNTASNLPVQVGSASNWQNVAVGGGFCIAVKTDGTIWGWGRNQYGQIGDGTVTIKTIPTQIGTSNTWQAVSVGEAHTIAVKANGSLWAWGYNQYNQLGDGTTVNKNTPVQIGIATDWQTIHSGNIHNIAKKSDGTLWSWGFNDNGELGDGTTVAKATPVQIGNSNTWSNVYVGNGSQNFATKTDGTLWCWGDNVFGSLGEGTTDDKTTPTMLGCPQDAQLPDSVSIVGDAVGGWPTGAEGEVDAKQMITNDHIHWTYDNLIVSEGTIKFRGNNSWSLPFNWGLGTGNFYGGLSFVNTDAIPTEAGVYDVTFNSETGAFTFIYEETAFAVLGVVGTAAPSGDWGVDTALHTGDGVTYTYTGLALNAGALKFRLNHIWSPGTNWGGAALEGTGVADGPNITIPFAGAYNVTFNLNTLAYRIYFPGMALVGAATPGGWPENVPGEIDAHQMATTDGIHYTLDNIILTEGAVKFRAGNSWVRQWGGSDFPSGIGHQQSGGDLMVTTAGTYGVTFNLATFAYAFTAPLSTADVAISKVKVYPNPASYFWNFESRDVMIKNIEITDISGKVITSMATNVASVAIDVSGFGNGMYFAKVATEYAVETIKLLKK